MYQGGETGLQPICDRFDSDCVQMKKKKWKYVRVSCKGHPNAQRNGLILKHRLVMSESLGRPLRDNEHVHHIDGDVTNNDLSNLELISNGDHTKLHKSKGGEATIEIICAYCGKKSFKLLRNIKFKRKIGQKDFYCNNKCSAKHFGRFRPKSS